MEIRKQTILGYVIVAIVCLVVGFFSGRWYLKHEIASAFQGALLGVEDNLSSTLTKGVPEIKATSDDNQADQSAKEKELAEEKKQYITSHLKLYDLHAEYHDSMLHGKVPGVTFKIKNEGIRTLSNVQVTVYFKNANGDTISEESYNPVLVTDFSFGDNNKPLKPGYIWQMEHNHFYSAKSVPSEWKEGAASAKITDIQFANPSAK